MTIDELKKLLDTSPERIEFDQVMRVINDNYKYTPRRFVNGTGKDQIKNEAGSNEGSCKIFSFGKLNQLNEKQTLSCFGHYYREDVLEHPDNTDHMNIRNFIQFGWGGIQFDGLALTKN